MKAIILAGGNGSRLSPITLATSKQLLPVYDKPLIYHALSTIMLAKIQDVLLITRESDQQAFQKIFGDGSNLGIKMEYAVQQKPNGIAEAINIGSDFIGDEDFCLILGDNIFFGPQFSPLLQNAKKNVSQKGNAVIFGYQVNNPENFGVIDLNSNNRVLSIEEKPDSPKTNYIATGLYFYPNFVKNLVGKIKPSSRGELEITDLNNEIISLKKLEVNLLGRGFAWFDCGTSDALLEASNFIHTVEKVQGFKIACLEEIALINGWIKKDQIVIGGNSKYFEYVELL